MATAWENAISSLNPAVWVKFDGTGVPVNSGSNGATLSLANGTGATTGVASPSNYGYTFNTADATTYSFSSFAANTLNDKIYTIEAVFKVPPTTGNTYQTIFRCDSGTNSIILRTQGVGMGQQGKLELYLCGNSGTGLNAYSLNRIDDGAYHHVALVANSTTYEVYIDGFRHMNGTYPAGTLNMDTAGTRYISNAPGEISNLLTIDELVIHNSALTQTQIYNNAKTVVPTAAELARIGGYTTTRPSIFYRMDETVNSTKQYNIGSTSNFEVTVGSITKSATGGPGTGYNGYYVTTPTGATTANNPGNLPNFTIATWVRRSANPSSTMDWTPYFYYDGQTNLDPSSGTGWSINTNGTLTARVRIGGVTVALTSTSSICDNTWKHVAFVRSGTSYILYINGVQEASALSLIHI